ncbi:hypothetical protein YC2023_115954 [Brassica napus]
MRGGSQECECSSKCMKAGKLLDFSRVILLRDDEVLYKEARVPHVRTPKLIIRNWNLKTRLGSTTVNYQNTLYFDLISKLKDDGKGELFDIQDEERKDEVEIFRTWRAKVEEIESFLNLKLSFLDSLRFRIMSIIEAMVVLENRNRVPFPTIG